MSTLKILLSKSVSVQNYIDAINGMGATPIPCENYDVSVEDYDGLILCGGCDINPGRYGVELNGSKKINDELDENEFKLAKLFIEAKKPVLGICRGCQLLNVYFGGSLYQHIDNAEEHVSDDKTVDLVHTVTTKENSILHRLYGGELVTNSYHHQAVKVLGKGLIESARTTDGTTCEAIEHTSLPVFGVQWHPERMCFAKARPDAADGKRIFNYFLEICKNH